jgi:hypothetical protein
MGLQDSGGNVLGASSSEAQGCGRDGVRETARRRRCETPRVTGWQEAKTGDGEGVDDSGEGVVRGVELERYHEQKGWGETSEGVYQLQP